MSLQTIGLFGNPAKDEIGGAIACVLERCRRESCATAAAKDLAPLVDADTRICEAEELARICDVIIAFGGDGTMLRAARSLEDSATPLLGINLGALGYLTHGPPPQPDDAPAPLFRGASTAPPPPPPPGVNPPHGREGAPRTALHDH
nr:NAD(+)/NADH kinase [bacterium]